MYAHYNDALRHAFNCTTGPAWAVVTGSDFTNPKDKAGWPKAWSRVNRSASGERWHDFYGFQDQLVGGLSAKGFLVAMPSVAGADDVVTVGITQSSAPPAVCAEQECEMYPAWYVHGTTKLRAGSASLYVTVLYPHDRSVPAASLAAGITAKWRSQGRRRASAHDGGNAGRTGARVEVTLRAGSTLITLSAEVATVDTTEARSLQWSVGRESVESA